MPNGSRDGRGFRLNSDRTTRESDIISEYYTLRRTAIKDIASYLGFLVGFIGSAPFAWGLLAIQLDAGRFARGLWYFFGIVTTAGIFSGIAGLGIGVAAGLLWEQVHRHRRSVRAAPAVGSGPVSATELDTGETPRLQLVTPAAGPLPDVDGRKLTSVRFGRDIVELDFSGHRISTAGYLVVAASSARFSNSDAGWREALCSVIGSRAQRVRPAPGERFEIQFENGSAVLMPRTSRTSTDEPHQIANES